MRMRMRIERGKQAIKKISGFYKDKKSKEKYTP